MKFSNRAFTLAEALIFLLVSALIVLASMPLITIKHLKKPDVAFHGKWACKIVDGKLRSAYVGNINKDFPDDNEWKEGCALPNIPANVSYVMAQIVGGGSAGGKAVFEYDDNVESKPEVMFPSVNGIKRDTYNVTKTGQYKLFLPGNKGTKGKLIPNSFDIVIKNITVRRCSYEGASPDGIVPYVTLVLTLNAGDKIILSEDPDENVEIEKKFICLGGPVQIKYVSEGHNETLEYIFKDFEADNGRNGKTKTFKLKSVDGSEKTLVKIKGTGGGYYISTDENCETVECTRFNTQVDRIGEDKGTYVTDLISDSDIEVEHKGIGNSTTETITSIGRSAAAYGGAGGNAGQVNVFMIEKPSPDTKIELEDIGKGGVYDTDESGNVIVDKCNGGDTTFKVGNRVYKANGGFCPEDKHNDEISGKDGEQANTMEEKDSVAGKGGESSVKTSILPLNIHGRNATGIGAGGGGGGVYLKLLQELAEYIKTESSFNDLVNNLKDKFEYGNGGNGASGGIILSW